MSITIGTNFSILSSPHREAWERATPSAPAVTLSRNAREIPLDPPIRHEYHPCRRACFAAAEIARVALSVIARCLRKPPVAAPGLEFPIRSKR